MVFAFNRPLTATRWNGMKVNASRVGEVKKVATRLIASRGRYEAVALRTGVPWWFIAVLHERESGGKFNTYLGNGEPLNRVTRLVPKGRGPWATFEDGCVDALEYEGYTKVTDWSIEHALYLAEKYNGFGYANKGLPSPYIWGATNIQRPGKYVADGKFDATVMDTQIGVAPMLQIISALVGGILPGLISEVTKSATNALDVTVAPKNAQTNIGSIIIGAIMAGLGVGGFGADTMHTISTIAGGLVVVLSTINHLGVINSSNANTVAMFEQLLTQLANYNPPIPEATPVVTTPEA